MGAWTNILFVNYPQRDIYNCFFFWIKFMKPYQGWIVYIVGLARPHIPTSKFLFNFSQILTNANTRA